MPLGCITPTISPSTINAVTKPFVTSATNTARNPVANAPMIGTNAPMKINDASGRASGTPRISSPAPMHTASTAATATVARTNPTSVSNPWLAAPDRRRDTTGTIRVTNSHIC